MMPPKSTPIFLSVIAPALNEADNLRELVTRVNSVFIQHGLRGEIVIVDDGSSDDSDAILKQLQSEFRSLVAVRHTRNRGIEQAWKSGLNAASGVYACLIDSDLQNRPEDIVRLLEQTRLPGTDVVQGFRTPLAGVPDNRKLFSYGLKAILNLIFRTGLKDPKSGFVLAPREILEHVLEHRLSFYCYQTFIAISAQAKGYTVREVPTMFHPRKAGSSYISRFPFKTIARCLVDVVLGVWEFHLLKDSGTSLSVFIQSRADAKPAPEKTLRQRLFHSVFFLTMPLHKWMITRRAGFFYHELERSQFLSPSDLRELQEKKLRRMVWHAFNHVAFYREKLEAAGIAPHSIRGLEDLARLPYLTKTEVRKHFDKELFADNADKARVLRISTSGSTGEPLTCFVDQQQLEYRWGATLRSLEWTGYRFGDRCARLWHQTIGMSKIQVVKEKIDAWLSRRVFFPAFEMNDASILSLHARLARFRPSLLDGYAESFNFLAKHSGTAGHSTWRPRGIVSSGQELPEKSRKAIEQLFGCKVFDKYGSREFSGIAYECDAHAGLHVVAENYIVEILKEGRPARPGEVGEVVVTDLNNKCLPFLRYRIGDLAVAIDNSSACECGRGLPRIGAVQGRVQSITVGANGNYVPGSFFSHLLKDYDYAIRHFQVLQKLPGAIVYRLVKGDRFTEETLQETIRLIRSYLGEATEVEVEFVDTIAMGRTGKRASVVSSLYVDPQQEKWSMNISKTT